MEYRCVFMGSPQFAVSTLRELTTNFNVVGVVTQPDRLAGRGRKPKPPAVKITAHELRLPIIQPSKLRQPEAMEQLHDWKPDVIVVAAFGQILRPEVLDLPPYGCINLHASLLPRWRGAAPIQAAILHDDRQTGVTIMRMDQGVDTGPLLSQKATLILENETTGGLTKRLADLGAGLLIETLPRYLSGKITPTPQEDQFATYAPMLKKEDGQLNFNQPAIDLVRQVLAFNPWPGAFTTWNDIRLLIHQASAISEEELDRPIPPGEHTIHHKYPAIGTAKGLLVLEEIQPAGKKSMHGKAFLQGARNWI